MKKSSLKDWFKVEVWRQSGGTLPELCDLADIREWLNETADDPGLDSRLSAVETTVSNMQPPPAVIDLSDASGSYDIEDGKNSIVVLTNNKAVNANEIILPAAIVGLRVTIINQDSEPVIINSADGEYINGLAGAELATLTSATFYCYADGKWAII
ncbi:MAG: hypothetical protein PHX12_06055 [Proteiniphilum sp.]|nr:hypothetical protein [Proteiniphilum sp.]